MSTDNEEQALYKLSQILRRDDDATLKEPLAFGYIWIWRTRTNDMWKSNESKDMICIQLFGQHLLLQNLKIAMLKEAAGVGPQQYCIFFNSAPSFFSKLKMIMAYLPI